MTTFPEDTRYFERYKLNRSIAHNQASQAWWPEGSDPGGANAGVPPYQVEASGEGERLSRKRKRSLSTSSGDDHMYDAEEAADELEKQGVPLDRKTASHDAQLQRLKNAQASKRSRTRLKTMKEQLDETQKQLDENKKALKLAEERARQAEERERQRNAENEYLRQQLENKR